MVHYGGMRLLSSVREREERGWGSTLFSRSLRISLVFNLES